MRRSSRSKIVGLKEAKEIIERWKSQGNKIVFTNGCFDILHLGHVDYLEKAKNLGDKLVVGINSDESIKGLKGENRPINSLISRSGILAALGFVDLVIAFKEETPIKLIEHMLPHILVKGNDYNISNIVGADAVTKNGGKVETIPLVQGFSTSAIIKKIKESK